MGKGIMMKRRAFLLTAGAAALVAATPAQAKKKAPPPPPPAPQVALPSSPNGASVRYFFERRNYAPVWFRQGAGDEAIGQLLSILRRAPVDGMPTPASSQKSAMPPPRR